VGLPLSKEQQQVLNAGVRAVVAGPGSGKTRTVISRFIATASALSLIHISEPTRPY
jgi:superfamily I DNA/RNA helicase